ncbi:Ankyrin repeat and SAM domain-containing protein 1A [Thelohanellus kitauei]|uniref:Ankyrin repeat and SAM domain-containing protein 1A n=1 Tax=Thelohanellus kitauei TaxID=669202 RepID=A0A0C2NFC0_THEKT|nr:Ankyrin repeat and SAM domain-containing protein 1A [Thelohanellus kitauei]
MSEKIEDLDQGSGQERDKGPESSTHLQDDELNLDKMLQEIDDFDLVLNQFLEEIDKDDMTATVPSTGLDLEADLIESSEGEESDTSEHVDTENKVYIWLKEIKMQFYGHDFLHHGYDDINFINEILEKEDLETIGVYNGQDICHILKCTEKLPKPPELDIENGKSLTTEDFLKHCNLSSYINSFISQGYDTFDTIKKLDKTSLLFLMDIKCIGHRKRICYYVRKSKLQMKRSDLALHMELPHVKSSEYISRQSVPPMPAVKSDKPMLGTIKARGSAESLNLHHPPSESSGHKPIEESYKPKTTEATIKMDFDDLSITTSKKPVSFGRKIGKFFKKIGHKNDKVYEATDIELRPSKGMDMLGNEGSTNPSPESSPVKSCAEQSHSKLARAVDAKTETSGIWMHLPDQLMFGSVSIISHVKNEYYKFLGMCPIKNIKAKGRKLTDRPTQKLKTFSMSIDKMPEVVINISAFDVTLLNKESKIKICAHDIKNIFFCSQDVADQRIFSFIHLENTKNGYYCSVFRCPSIKSCTEAVLALGFAFKLCSNVYKA